MYVCTAFEHQFKSIEQFQDLITMFMYESIKMYHKAKA